MASNADRLRALLLAQVGDDYHWGAEIPPGTLNPARGDCSEYIEWAFGMLGYRVPDGSRNQYANATDIRGPERVGDLFFLKDMNARVHHVGAYIGKGQVFEAKGEAYGVILTDLDDVARRGGIWRRFTYDLNGRRISMGALSTGWRLGTVYNPRVGDAGPLNTIARRCKALGVGYVAKGGVWLWFHATHDKYGELAALADTMGCQVTYLHTLAKWSEIVGKE